MALSSTLQTIANADDVDGHTPAPNKDAQYASTVHQHVEKKTNYWAKAFINKSIWNMQNMQPDQPRGPLYREDIESHEQKPTRLIATA